MPTPQRAKKRAATFGLPLHFRRNVMKSHIPASRYWLSAILVFFVVPQMLAGTVFKGTAMHDILMHLAVDPVFGLGLVLGTFPPHIWWLDGICALLWFFTTSTIIQFGELFFKQRGIIRYFWGVQIGIIVVAIAMCIVPNGKISGTLESVVLQKLSPGITFSQSRSLVPRQWRSGMYSGIIIDDQVIQQDERLSGDFFPDKDWSRAKREFAITRVLPDGSEEHAYLYFDENDKLIFWKHSPL